MDKIVSLCKRRGFVFPSSEIYGGLGSTYDYGHYGVLMKNNIRSQWFRSMVQERDDMVALDSAVILNPTVWEASGHVAGFTDPLVDCRTCKLRFRADRLEDAQCGKRPSKRPGEDAECELTEARQFNLMFQTQVGAMEDASSTRVPPPRDRAGDLHQLQERDAARAAQAAVRHRADRQVVPQRDHARQLPLPRARVRADGDGVLRAARRGAAVVRVLDRAALQWYLDLGLRAIAAARPRARRRRSARTTRAATSDIEYLYPIGWQELEGVANRGDFDLTQHTQASGTKLEWVGQDGERYTPHVIEPAVSDRADLRRDARRRATTRRSSPSATARCCACTRRSRRSRRRSCR